MAQTNVTLECMLCGSRNYTTSVSSNHTERLVIKKYCKHCGKSTNHKETK